MSILLSVLAIVVAVDNVVFNVIWMFRHWHNQSEREDCIDRIKLFGYLGGFDAGMHFIFTAMQRHYNAFWPNIFDAITAILVMMVLALGMIMEYEEIKWTP